MIRDILNEHMLREFEHTLRESLAVTNSLIGEIDFDLADGLTM